jgi:hypothetical protein
MDVGDDFKVPPKDKKKSYEVEYDSFSQSKVEKTMMDDAEHICGILGVEVSHPEVNYRMALTLSATVPARHCQTLASPLILEQRGSYREVHGQSDQSNGFGGHRLARGGSPLNTEANPHTNFLVFEHPTVYIQALFLLIIQLTILQI